MVLGLLLLLSQAAAATDKLDALLKKAMTGTQTPAVAVLVIRNGHIAEQAVRGVRRSDRPDKATRDDVWLLGSTSKVMTVAMISKLVEHDLVVADTAEDMGGDKATKAVLDGLFPSLSPAK